MKTAIRKTIPAPPGELLVSNHRAGGSRIGWSWAPALAPRPVFLPRRCQARQAGFSLMEIIAVLVVLALLALALTVPAIKRLDRIAGDKEAASLKSFGEALTASTLRNRHIPASANWAQVVAAELGVQVSNVQTNDRRQPRIFLIDPEFQIGVNSSGLPYLQPVTGSRVTNIVMVIPPISPRLLILSSISQPLPVQLVSGVGLASGPYSFKKLWDCPEGSLPVGWTWNGRPDDVKIQRVDFSPHFVQLILNNRDTNNPAYYTIDGVATNMVPFGGVLPMYFIANTELGLLNTAQVLEYTEILKHPNSFTYELGTWRGEVYLGRGVDHPGPLDLQRAMNLFMASPSNTFAKLGASQPQVYDLMIAYMSNFIVWRDSGYPGQERSQPPAALRNAESDLSTVSKNMINPQ